MNEDSDKKHHIWNHGHSDWFLLQIQISRAVHYSRAVLKPFHVTGLFLYALEISETMSSDFCQGVWKEISGKK